MKEIWKPVEGYNGCYEVSNFGSVRSVDRVDFSGNNRKGKVLQTIIDRYGYPKVHLSLFGKSKYHFVHRLVATAFIDNPENFPQVNHKDEDKTNNCVQNLEWCTAKHNINYGQRNRLVSCALYGENAYFHKLTQKEVDEIREKYKPRSKENSIKKLSERYGVSETQISRIVNNKKWKCEKGLVNNLSLPAWLAREVG